MIEITFKAPEWFKYLVSSAIVLYFASELLSIAVWWLKTRKEKLKAIQEIEDIKRSAIKFAEMQRQMKSKGERTH